MIPARVAPAFALPRWPGARALASRAAEHVRRLSLATQFLVASLLVLTVATIVIGAWVDRQVEDGVLLQTGQITALYVDSMVAPRLQSVTAGQSLSDAEMKQLDWLLTGAPLGREIVSFKVWSLDGQILYSPDRALIGERFPVDSGLQRALGGDVAAQVTSLNEPQNAAERQQWSRLVDVYAPVRSQGEGQVFAVVEFYQTLDSLQGQMHDARYRSWAVVGGVGLLTYLLLAGIVKRGSDTIVRQESSLRRRVSELGALLEENRRLHRRVRDAGARTTALNEQALRRISADLHDGPAQALALALLRLEALQEPFDLSRETPARADFETVQNAVRDALGELRTISAGLRLPEIAPLAVADVVRRGVHMHEMRGGARVQLEIGRVPLQAPLSVKIAVLRTLQEALSNASRHGRGQDVRVKVWSEEDCLHACVSDAGPGFDPSWPVPNGHERLGLAGMRERAELLGGGCKVTSALEVGSTVHAWWPLETRGDG